jgi:competence protein ComEA
LEFSATRDRCVRSDGDRFYTNCGAILNNKAIACQIQSLDPAFNFYIFGKLTKISNRYGSECRVVRFGRDGKHAAYIRSNSMLKLSRLPVGLLALTIAAPVFAQPATTPTNPTPPSGAMAPATPKAPDSASRSMAAVPKAGLVDINSATAAELQALPGVSEADSTKIIHGRPYTDTNQLVSRHVLSEATFDKIKDRVVTKQPKS